jgi:Cysteine rich repeat
MNHSVVLSLTKFIAMSGFALATLWFAASAAADQRAAMQVCRADAQKLCASTSPGGGRIAACLRENEAQLSPGCQAQLGRLEACAAEVKQLCPQAQGEGALRQCARAKRSEISEGCRAATGG